MSERSERVIGDEALRGAPTWTPNPTELSDLELLLAGAYAPLGGFLGRDDLRSVAATSRLVDGRPWPLQVKLEVPAGMLDGIEVADAPPLVLTDAEGAPVARLDVAEVWPTREGWCGVAGPVTRYGDGGRAPFDRLRMPTDHVRGLLTAQRVLGYFADRPLHRPQLAQLNHAARQLNAQLVVLVPVGAPGPDGLTSESLVRCVLAARDRMNEPVIVAIPLASRGNEITDALIRARVAAAYGATHLLGTATTMSGGGPRVLIPRELVYDSRDGQWRDRDEVPERFERIALTDEEIAGLLDDGLPLPEWHTPPAVARELSKARPPRRQRGVVLFFTGFSGSGKSTVARGVADALLETGERSLTVLDGDVVRRELSAGLGFSKADRDLNIRRIGWVAAETARHGGMAICCPIAPYASARANARAMATAAGADFVLVHVATPIEVCEQRDRKGLYARARAGQITGMTGIDDPYEVPTDAELVLDTSEGTIDDAVDTVLVFLGEEGWINPRS
ncbi:adenylyl-sulfate kinase [Catellatospora sp. NPDC049111]|uniref:adenylyl-sulfate kinase n=1 Tax=Catellatospora sp. NPDC049111 TaxID=3155271 RepID=UPI00340F74AD